MTKDRICQGHFIFIIALGAVCLFAGASLAAGGIKFSAAVDKVEYKTDEPINITFTLKNEGKDAVYINKRFYIGLESMPKEKRDIYLLITAPSGKKLSSSYNYEMGLPKSDYFELLEPGKEVKSEYPRNLNGFFEFTDPGTYKVVAVYQNVFGSEIGLEVFKEKLTSEPLSFTVIKPDSIQGAPVKK